MDSSGTPSRIAMTPGAQRVLRAAARLFYERGIHAVGVDLIAAEAGVTKKTLYDRFGSKEQLVLAYLADRDGRWRSLLASHFDTARTPVERILAVFDASGAWMRANGARGCSMVNAHAEISDPNDPAYAVIMEQKRWMLALFTDLAGEIDGEIDRDEAERLGRTLMLLHEGALVAHGMNMFADPIGDAREQARSLLDTVTPEPSKMD